MTNSAASKCGANYGSETMCGRYVFKMMQGSSFRLTSLTSSAVE